MTRIEQVNKNIKYSVLIYILNCFLKFGVRLVFIRTLPIEYLGINGLFTNLLSILSLAELGIGPAIVYSLYKPLAYNDTETIKSLMNLFKKAYIVIGSFIIIVGICILPCLDWLIKDNNIVDIDYFYMIFLLNTGVSYFYSYKRNLIIADQKQYINSIYEIGSQVLLAVMQIAVLTIYPNYWLYIILMLIVTIGENFTIAKKTEKLYPYINDRSVKILDNDIKDTITRNIKAMIIHKIGGMAVFSTSNIILSKFIGLGVVGIYGNYCLVINVVNNFTVQFVASVTASIGNLVALESNEKKNKVFNVIEFLVAWQAMIASCGFYVLFNVLIKLWIGEQFLFTESIVSFLIVNFYLSYMRVAVNTFKNASGLYWHDRYKPLAEAVINLVSSVYLTIHYGVIGVIWGGIISTLLTCFWVEPYVLFRNGINIKLKDYFKDYFKYTVVTFLTAIFSKWLYGKLFIEVTIINFVLGVILCLLISNTVWIFLFRKREEMIYLRDVARDKFGMKFL